MKFSIEDFFSKCDRIRSFLQIWSYLLKKSLMENFIFCEVTMPYYIKHTTQINFKSLVFGKSVYLHTIIFISFFCFD